MTALSTEQVGEIREWVGSTPDDTTLQATFDEMSTIRDTIRRILRKRRADLIANPAQFSIPGEYSQNTGDNLKYIDALLVSLEDADLDTEVASATPLAPSVRHLVRDGSDEFVGR